MADSGKIFSTKNVFLSTDKYVHQTENTINSKIDHSIAEVNEKREFYVIIRPLVWLFFALGIDVMTSEKERDVIKRYHWLRIYLTTVVVIYCSCSAFASVWAICDEITSNYSITTLSIRLCLLVVNLNAIFGYVMILRNRKRLIQLHHYLNHLGAAILGLHSPWFRKTKMLVWLVCLLLTIGMIAFNCKGNVHNDDFRAFRRHRDASVVISVVDGLSKMTVVNSLIACVQLYFIIYYVVLCWALRTYFRKLRGKMSRGNIKLVAPDSCGWRQQRIESAFDSDSDAEKTVDMNELIRMHDLLCKSVALLEDCFVELSGTWVVSDMTCLIFFLRAMAISSTELDNARKLSVAASFVTVSAMFLITTFSATSVNEKVLESTTPLTEVDESAIQKILTSKNERQAKIEIKRQLYLQYVHVAPPLLTCCGLFVIRQNLIITISSNVLTYVLILNNFA